MTGNEIRQTFLDYFQRQGHQIVRSSSLVPADDPTLLFTNAGMVQFKRVFLGDEKRPYQRAVTSQKCVRAGGKHNDLENVGYTARHHTFFEMLGNFSFGDYFKEKAIEFGWDLLTSGFGLPADRLWVSIYLDDDEAFELWQRVVGIPAERIVRFGEKDNFWAMGDTGPCGPCSEIHLDRGPGFGCGRPDCRLGCECDRYLELWNLVFMQFNRDAEGRMTPLPKPSIDTGAGLERIAAVLQNKENNFETDLICPIIDRAADLAGCPYGRNREGDVALKVIADHSRAAAFLIGDGILPSNEGRGYVLRRIMRRAIRYGRNIGLTDPFLHETARVVFEIMRPAYPELGEAASFITNVIRNEEVRFSETLDHGLKVLGDALGELRAQGRRDVPGEVIFKLYDTFGFPVDIVRDVVRDEGLTLDMAGFEAGMAAQRAQSRRVASFGKLADAFRDLSSRGIQPVFVGYEGTAAEARVLLVVADGQGVAEAGPGTEVEIVTDRTPFYGEAGGQVGDQGRITTAEGGQVAVEDTIKDPTGLIIHKGRVTAGRIGPDQRVEMAVDPQRRAATARNHTATHILHGELRAVLGDHVKQAGSLVSPERLRFDFTHFSPIEAEALAEIEARVNARVRANVPVAVDEMDAETAFQSGAMALFEEKYGDRVRVVSLSDFSKELCGGTHAGRTGDIGLFVIVSEASVASGVRRVEALTGEAAVAHVQARARILAEAARRLKAPPEALAERIERLMAEQRRLEKELTRLKTEQAAAAAGAADDDEARTVAGVPVMVRQVAVDNPAALRDLADRFRDRLGSGVVVLGAESEGKALLVAAVTRDLTQRFHAGRIIRAAAAEVGGGGGGRPDLAQAGGNRPENLDAALAAALAAIKEMGQGKET
jgi:alanyl-tRNA synthetase